MTSYRQKSEEFMKSAEFENSKFEPMPILGKQRLHDGKTGYCLQSTSNCGYDDCSETASPG